MIAWAFAGFLALVYGTWWMLPSTIDPDLKPYVTQFVADANRYGHNISMEDVNYVGFHDLGEVIAGFGLAPNVLIHSELKGSPYLRELVYHELGHSIFGCGHSETPSIMWDEQFITYQYNWDSYVESLFTTEFKELGCSK